MDELVEKKIKIIVKAIRFREVLSFLYDDGEKYRVEPYVFGISEDTGKHVLCCHHSTSFEVRDYMKSWKFFELDKMTDVRLTAVRIKDTRRGSDEIDPNMS